MAFGRPNRGMWGLSRGRQVMQRRKRAFLDFATAGKHSDASSGLLQVVQILAAPPEA